MDDRNYDRYVWWSYYCQVDLMMDSSEFYIDHEVRIRLLVKISKDTNHLLRWILGVVITIGIPVLLHAFNLL